MWESYIILRTHTMGDNAMSGQSKITRDGNKFLAIYFLREIHACPIIYARISCSLSLSLSRTPPRPIHVRILTNNLINYCPKSKFISPGIRENENIQLGFYFNGSFLLSKCKSYFNQISMSIRQLIWKFDSGISRLSLLKWKKISLPFTDECFFFFFENKNLSIWL